MTSKPPRSADNPSRPPNKPSRSPDNTLEAPAIGEAGFTSGDTQSTDTQSTDAETTVAQLRQIMRDFVSERDWEKFHNAKNLSMSLAIEAGELMEHFQWLTTDEVVSGRCFNRDEIADELADVVCYALSLSNALDLDLSQAIQQKMVKNRLKYPAP